MHQINSCVFGKYLLMLSSCIYDVIFMFTLNKHALREKDIRH